MPQLKRWLLGFLKYEPAILAWAVNGGVALVLAYVFHLGKTQEAAAAVIVAALATLWTAFLARPVSVSLVLGAITTISGALAAFHIHPSASVLSFIDAGLSALLPLLMRANLTPVTVLKLGKSARPLRLEA